MEDYDTTFAGRAIAEFVDDLSNWYVRRLAAALLGRRPGGVRDAARVPARRWRSCWRRSPRSWPTRSTRTSTGRSRRCTSATSRSRARATRSSNGGMQVARDAVELGRAARAHAKVKVRQPLREAVVVAADRERAAIERFEALVRDELNVKSLRFVSEADELGRFELKPNYRTLGPRFGKQMPQVAAAIAALDPAALRAGEAGGHQPGRPRARDRPRRRAAGAPAARRLPGGALGHARGGARPRAGRRAAPRGRSPARWCTPCRRRARAPASRWRTGSR